jgi:subtilisin-like proprotein convertase family protein
MSSYKHVNTFAAMKNKKVIFIAVLLFSFWSFSQNEKTINYFLNEVPKSTIEQLGDFQIEAINAKYYFIDVQALRDQMIGVAHRDESTSGFVADIQFPHPDGSLHSYLAKGNSTLALGLQHNFPEIRTYDASSALTGSYVKWDITPKGLHAMIMIPGESTIFIDPIIAGNSDYYIVYHRKDFVTSKSFECTFNGDTSLEIGSKDSGTNKMFGTCELRTYRLALSATGEYTVFHGGTVALALAAQATSMNRVNGVFEKDMAITMTIIANNNLIVYTNPTTDPFTNGNPGTMINENQTNTDAVIGSANYDIGHVFGTNSGGLAGLGVVCAGGNKARGVTGSASPIGDPFDIDYVAHEIGHQYGANHTQNNNCNRNGATAVEPGSASTIMGYAGICTPNVQNNSDDHFSGKSLEEMHIEIMSAGHTCEVITSLANNAPVIISSVGNITVPISTPFALTVQATDADANTLTYNWEQMDNEVSTQPPVATSIGGPNFRSNPSSTSPTRYFPSLASLATNGPYTWEVLPSVARIMDFRVTVRDNAPGPGGCNDYEDIRVTTDAGSGPFLVLNPTTTGISWAGASSQTVTWDVANTANAPVACANVDILLSIDGGLTYPTVLATNVPNNGSFVITVPNTPSTICRIMVICSSGTFFDISNNNFTITAAAYDYSMAVSPSSVSICQPEDALFAVTIGSFNDYVDPVTLAVTGVPAGANAVFTVNPVIPAGSSTLTISNTDAAIPGTYNLVVTANSTSGTKTSNLTLSILDATPDPVGLISPANAAVNIAVPTVFTWEDYPESGATYHIQIATDPGFTSIVDEALSLTSATYSSSVLALNTGYYWRVRVQSACGISAFGSTFSFSTSGCVVYNASEGLPATIPNSGTITRTISIPSGGVINDVNVRSLVGTHTRMGDLTFRLTSPQGTVVTLMANVCGNDDNFNIGFDDNALSAVIPCPPTTGLSYQPVGSLAAFNGQDAAGTWTLTIIDAQNPQGGSLTAWAIEICVDPPSGCIDPATPLLSFSTSPICEGQEAVLNITGLLNSATNWRVYSGSCGDNLVGTTASSTFTIPNTMNQTYYVRGEDGAGCVDETLLPCASIAAVATAVPDAPAVSVVNDCGSSLLTANGSGLLWSTGETSTSITVTLPDSYSVTQSVNGCVSTSSVVNANPLSVSVPPTVSVVDFCGYSVLTAEGTNLEWSTGETTSSIVVTSGGSYSVTQNENGCISAPNSITASPASPGAISLGGVVDPSSCGATDASITVNGTGTGDLNWTGAAVGSSNGVTLPYTITGLASGSYTLTFTNACDSNPINVTVNGGSQPPAPTVTVVNECGFSVLTADGAGLQWSTSETSSSITVNSSNIVYVSQTVGGCTGPVATVNPAPLTVPIVEMSPLADVCINSPAFELIQGSPTGGVYSGPGVSGNNFDPELAGYGTFLIYYEYTSTNGCSGIAHQPITVGCAQVQEVGDILLTIYPNPKNGNVLVSIQNDRLQKVSIVDQRGRLVFEGIMDAESFEFNFSQKAEGVYTFMLTTLNGQFSERIVYIK